MYQFYLNNQHSELKQLIINNHRANETQCVNHLLASIKLTDHQQQSIQDVASNLIKKIRNQRRSGHGVDVIMNEFQLSTNEGVALMCLAESLLRIPDKKTQDKLIKDQLSRGNWKNFTNSENSFVNAASWGLLITGKLTQALDSNSPTDILYKIIAKGGEPLIRKAMKIAVTFMGNQFVISDTIDNALKLAKDKQLQGYTFSFDMLGEAALTDTQAVAYLQEYIDAIHAVGKASNNLGVINSSGVSVKLSAIHPCYNRFQRKRVMTELYSRLKQLFILAKSYNIGLFIDAEESNRLLLSLELLEKLVYDKELQGFAGIGFVVQAYQKRAPYVIDYIAKLARESGTRLMVRLVKGAYWDSEIKQAQLEGQIDYPVYTRKFYTDLSYIHCVEKLFSYNQEIYPSFATHNAHSLALVNELGSGKEFEFQCLYGMGETLYNQVVGKDNFDRPCRIYAPVGKHDVLLAYLVRRLLENGANSSFVHKLVDKDTPIASLVESPIKLATLAHGLPNPNFNLPLHIYPHQRLNSKGYDLANDDILLNLSNNLNSCLSKQYIAYPLIANLPPPSLNNAKPVINPANKYDQVGHIISTTVEQVASAIDNAVGGYNAWSNLECNHRANILYKMADLIELNSDELIGLLVREAGKTIANAISEIREAVDFCRYYATVATLEFTNNQYKPLGVVVCISPWNFPLAIFIGEISSALVVGNAVIAKPSNQTNLIAFYAVSLFHKAGVPNNVLQLLPGSGSLLGNLLTKDIRINGVIFTGSTETAQLINKNLASKNTNSVLIAETGGQNTMIVDSSTLPEQAVTDIVSSGFDSAGQRCSALRVLYLQADIADKIIDMLKGVMDELIIGNPMDLATDIGPVIDSNAMNDLVTHIAAMKLKARQIYQTKLPTTSSDGYFIPPTIIEIGSINELTREVFGPIIHIIRFASNQLEDIINQINSSGYGLTQGIHSRINSTSKLIYEKIRAGNIYVNRNMVGAVVGVQPFGGEGLSGTGPKAGGPLYLYRLVRSNINPQIDNFANKTVVANNELDSFVNQLKHIFSDSQYNDLLNYAKMVNQTTLINRRIDLVGPTGESNFMYFSDRGIIGCFANDIFDYAKQIICALGNENKVVLVRNDINRNFSSIYSNKILFCDNLEQVKELNAVLISNNFSDKLGLKQQLANRSGCLTLIIDELDNGSYPLYLLTTEKSVSINITANGGNLQLMNINDTLM
jgi:RHH-type proline utilization regulon transcriptional repressor/proline dehydrogenase/delta 1-pyrroline-5-carboxylate dehydrogenase